MASEQPFAEQASRQPSESCGDSGDEIVTRQPDRIEAWSRAFVVNLLWIALGAGALVLQFLRVFDGLYLSESMDLAQLGRHLAAGQGFVTTFLRPVEVVLYPQVPAPEILHAPLYPLLLGLVFGILPQSDEVVAGVSGFFFIATFLLIYLLASKLFDRGAGILAAVLFALNALALGYAVSGLHITLWAFLLTLVVYLLYVNRGSSRCSLAAGAVLGLGCLTEYMTFALIVPALIAAYYAQSERRRRHLGWFAAGLIAVMIPWWVRNSLVARDPFFTLERYLIAMFTGAHPGHTLFRAADPSALNVWQLLAAAPRQIAAKAILGLASGYRTIPPLVGLYVVGFFVAAVMRPLGAPRRNLVRKAALLFLVFLGVIGALHNPTAELFFVLVPLIVALCGGYFTMLAREWIPAPRWRAFALVLFVTVSAYPALVSWALPQPKAISSKRNLDHLRQALPEKAVVVTDAPWAVAWYANRAAVWLPLAPKDFEAVDRRIGVDAIYFSTLLASYPAMEQALMWQRIYAERAAPPSFEAAALPEPGEVLLVKAVQSLRRGGPRH